MEGMWIVAGLGNPGADYERTRHNVGFMAVDELARDTGIECRRLEKSALVGIGEVSGQRVLICKPMTSMNNSGDPLAALAESYKIPPTRILVISDDMDQPTAGVKLKPKGGHGGHNGLRSIIGRIGDAFPRLKIGIGRPAGAGAATYVLQDFSKREKKLVDAALGESVVDVVRSVLILGLDRALSGV